jgi:hypothetical protein
MRLVVEWGHGRREVVGSVAEMDVLLDAVVTDARLVGMPQDIQVTLDEAGTLGIVVGADRSVLNHIPSHRDPPYMVSVGNEDADAAFVFYVAGDHYSEIPWRNTIPSDAAREAVRHFARTGELSPEVAWEEV